MRQQVRANYGASLSPDATAFAHLVDDGGYPRAVQRFLRGWRASSSRDVELPVEGPVTRVIHSADGHWLACEVAPDGGNRSQIWVVTTDPDDRMARRIDWPRTPGHRRADRLGRHPGGGDPDRRGRRRQSCLIDPADGTASCWTAVRRPTGRRVGGCVAGPGRARAATRN